MTDSKNPSRRNDGLDAVMFFCKFVIFFVSAGARLRVIQGGARGKEGA